MLQKGFHRFFMQVIFSLYTSFYLLLYICLVAHNTIDLFVFHSMHSFCVYIYLADTFAHNTDTSFAIYSVDSFAPSTAVSFAFRLPYQRHFLKWCLF